MKSNETLKKYIEVTFDKSVNVEYTSNFTADIKMIDGVIHLLALNNVITVYIDGKEYQSLEYYGDCEECGSLFRVISIYDR